MTEILRFGRQRFCSWLGNGSWLSKVIRRALKGAMQLHLVILKKHDAEELWQGLKHNLGREVFVTGQLYQGRTSHYWTSVALELEKIVPAPRNNDRE